MSAAEVQLGFDYEALEPETRTFVRERSAYIHARARRVAGDIVQIGEELISVKARLGHGRFQLWIASEFGWSYTTAYNFMNVNRTFKSSTVEDLKIDCRALYLIAAPSTPEPIRHEIIDRAKAGEHITLPIVEAELAKQSQPPVEQAQLSEPSTSGAAPEPARKQPKRMPPPAVRDLAKKQQEERDIAVCAPVADAIERIARCIEPHAAMWESLARLGRNDFARQLERAIQYLVQLDKEHPNVRRKPSVIK